MRATGGAPGGNIGASRAVAGATFVVLTDAVLGAKGGDYSHGVSARARVVVSS